MVVIKLKLFNSKRYTKEGKGISKDAPEKHGFIKFWEIAWFKKYNLIALNLFYFIPNLIALALTVLSFIVSISLFTALTGYNIQAESSEASLFLVMLCGVAIFFTVIPVFAVGPFQSGMTYILRCFTKREPCFLWTEYIGKTRSNLKLSIKASIINALAGFLIMLDFSVYMALTSANSEIGKMFPEWMLTASLVVLIFLSALFLIMCMYIYPMIVTFRLTLKQLYKNAMLFAFIRWLPNLGILLLDAALVFVPLFFVGKTWGLYVVLLIYMTIGITFVGFINMSFTYPTIKKCMIDNYKADKSIPDNNNSTEIEKNESDFDIYSINSENTYDNNINAFDNNYSNDGVNDKEESLSEENN